MLTAVVVIVVGVIPVGDKSISEMRAVILVLTYMLILICLVFVAAVVVLLVSSLVLRLSQLFKRLWLTE